jgi:hypothetical protein
MPDESRGTFEFRAPSAASDGAYASDNVAVRSGEQRLILAILEDAVSIFIKSLCGGVVVRKEAHAARAWLESRDRSLPFTFESICDALGFDASYIRRGLWALRATPTEAAARLAVRHHGGSLAPAAPSCTEMRATDVAPARYANAERVVVPGYARHPVLLRSDREAMNETWRS